MAAGVFSSMEGFMNTIKRSLLVAAAGFAIVAANAFAQPVKLTDADLDNITAGSAISANVISNSGQASVFRINGDPTSGSSHVVCVNCAEIPLPPGAQAHLVVNPSGTVAHCKGAGCGLIPPSPSRK
jgi:hypothetical protein